MVKSRRAASSACEPYTLSERGGRARRWRPRRLRGAERRHFDDFAAGVHVHEPEAPADDERAAEQRLHLLRRRVGGDVEVLRLDAEQQVADGAADHESLEARFLQVADDRARAVGQLRGADGMLRRTVDARCLRADRPGSRRASRRRIMRKMGGAASGSGRGVGVSVRARMIARARPPPRCATGPGRGRRATTGRLRDGPAAAWAGRRPRSSAAPGGCGLRSARSRASGGYRASHANGRVARPQPRRLGNRLHARRAGASVGEIDAVAQRGEMRRFGRALHLHPVRLRQLQRGDAMRACRAPSAVSTTRPSLSASRRPAGYTLRSSMKSASVRRVPSP